MGMGGKGKGGKGKVEKVGTMPLLKFDASSYLYLKETVPNQ